MTVFALSSAVKGTRILVAILHISYSRSDVALADMFIQTSDLFCQDYITLVCLALQKQPKRMQQAQSCLLVPKWLSRGYVQRK